MIEALSQTGTKREVLVVASVDSGDERLPVLGHVATGEAERKARGEPPTTDWAKIAREIKPDPRNRGLYDGLYATWRELYPATKDQVHRLAATTPGSVVNLARRTRQTSKRACRADLRHGVSVRLPPAFSWWSQ